MRRPLFNPVNPSDPFWAVARGMLALLVLLFVAWAGLTLWALDHVLEHAGSAGGFVYALARAACG